MHDDLPPISATVGPWRRDECLMPSTTRQPRPLRRDPDDAPSSRPHRRARSGGGHPAALALVFCGRAIAWVRKR